MSQPADVWTSLTGGAAAAIVLTDGAERASWTFTRCFLNATRFEDHGRDPAHLDSALADFAALPEHAAGRAKLAGILVVGQLRAGILRDPDRFAAAAELAEIANTDPRPPPQWPQAYAVIRALGLMYAGSDGAPGFRPRTALAELDRYAEVVGDLTPHVTMITMARLALEHLVAQEEGNLSATHGLTAATSALSDQHAAGSPLHGRAAVLDALMKANAAALRGDLAAATAAMQAVLDAAELIPPGDLLRVQVEQMRVLVSPFLQMLQPAATAHQATAIRVDATVEAQIRNLTELAALPGLAGGERAMRLAALGVAELALDTPAALDSAVGHLADAVAAAPDSDPRQVHYQMSLGVARLRRYEVTGRRDDLPAGTATLERARELAGSSFHTYWTMCSNPLAHAYRLSGRRALGRQVALSGLRGHAWTVLLQGSPRDVQDAARHAAEDAVDVARWCLQDDDPESAATALDAGRGLILYAATETRGVEARLLEQKEDRLAGQWRQALATSGPDMPGELRREVAAALAGIPLGADGSMTASPGQGSTSLLDPPSGAEMRLALRALDADALVYLVPGDDGSGAAVVVPADAPPSWLQLPRLTARALADFDRYVAAEQVRSGPDGTVRDVAYRSQQALEAVCDWAWDAAVGPLVQEHLTMPADRPIRLVLIPMRELARVPWHAARRRLAGRTEYALRRVVFSYAPSARVLCESAWRKDVPLTAGGLVVGDPDPGDQEPDLPAARTEALAVRSAFYPQAGYVGRTADGATAADGAGTRADLLRWLDDPAGGAMIHLACHGVLRSGGDETSYLLLAGGERLSAEALTRRLTTGGSRDVGLAVLAACRSAESGRGDDEAFSLSTALLASNVRSVISAQWSVPDVSTSVLMFMVHHFLREEGLRPADALHEAQLWMILDRQPPDTMPAELRELLEEPGFADLLAWAAFVHLGR